MKLRHYNDSNYDNYSILSYMQIIIFLINIKNFLIYVILFSLSGSAGLKKFYPYLEIFIILVTAKQCPKFTRYIKLVHICFNIITWHL